VSDPSDQPRRPRPAPEGASQTSDERRREGHHHHPVSKGLRATVRVGLIVLLLVVSGAVFGVLVATRETSRTSLEPDPPIEVRSVVATPRAVERVWEGFGTARSMSRAEIAAEVSGRVIERPADAEPGRAVGRGALLLAIDPTDYEARAAGAEQGVAALRAQIDGLAVETERLGNQVALAEEEIGAASRDYERTRQAVEQGAGSQGELDARLTAVRRAQREQDALCQRLELIPSRRRALEAELAARQADLRLARENLARTRVVSPIDGRIQSLTPREGDFVQAGTPVASVVDTARVEIPLRLPASALAWLDAVVGVEGAVSLWNGPAVGPAAHVGRITRLSPEADPATRTVTVFVEVVQDPEDPERLLPGVFVHGRVRTPDPRARVVVPRRAVRSGRLMLLEPGADGEHRVVVRPVETGYALDARFPEVDPAEREWVVLAPGSEPSPGSRVAVTALEQLAPGTRVRLAGERGDGAGGAGSQGAGSERAGPGGEG
jgi:RND family efflux transporter MFP subunit